MTNFQYFKKQCSDGKRFLCYIVYNDGSKQFIENNLAELVSVQESEISNFRGTWESSRNCMSRIRMRSTYQNCNDVVVIQSWEDFIKDWSVRNETFDKE